LVYKKIEIGRDFVCAWNVFISDSDWHQIGKQSHQADIYIGDHVWIANSCSILKGSQIGNNCIVASYSKVIKSKYESDSMLAGTPARIVKSDIFWSRDIDVSDKL
jgi:acetyltransferase-like isoleucine patch superfamily enzyme